MIGLLSYLLIAFFLFVSGLVIVLARKSIIAILIGIELILNAGSLNFVAYSKYVTNSLDGHVFSIFIIVVAAAEAAVGLGIAIRFFQIKESIHIDDATELLN